MGSLRFIKGDIAECSADVVIVSAARHVLSIWGGAQGSACFAASDWEIEKELRDKYGYNEHTVLAPGEITVVGGYNLCSYILLVQAPRAYETGYRDSDLKRVYLNAFAKALDLMANSNGVVRIACTLMSSGRGGKLERERVGWIAKGAAEEFINSSNRDVDIAVYSLFPVEGMEELFRAHVPGKAISWDSETTLKEFVLQVFNRRLEADPSVNSDREIAEIIGYSSSTLSQLKSGKINSHRIGKACSLACLCESVEEIEKLLRLCGLKPPVVKLVIDSGAASICKQYNLRTRAGEARAVTACVEKALQNAG